MWTSPEARERRRAYHREYMRQRRAKDGPAPPRPFSKVPERRRRWLEANREKIRQQMADWEKKNPERRNELRTRSRLRREYGITLEEYEAMLAAQQGKCAACAAPLDCGKLTHIDHDHLTGRVRGVLCHPCNLTAGYLESERRGLVETYLRKFEENTDG